MISLVVPRIGDNKSKLEPLQEKATQMIVQLEEEKKSMSQAYTKSASLM
jgi:hypothetical protein